MATNAKPTMPKKTIAPPAAPVTPAAKTFDGCRPILAWPLTAALVLVVLAVSIFTTLNCYELGLMKGREQLLAKKVLELESRLTAVAQPKTEIAEPAPLQPEGKILAGAPDNSFVLRGTQSCGGEFSVGPATADPSDPNVVTYDLLHPITAGDNDFGMIRINPASAYTPDGSGTWREEFRTGSVVAEAVYTSGATGSYVDFSGTEVKTPDCKVWAAER